MANFGLSRLRLVKPREGWPNPQARKMASGADRILDEAELFDTRRGGDRRLHPGAGDHGARARPGQARDRRARPRRLRRARIAAGETVGVLFGRERNGLENDEVGACRPHRHPAGQSGLRLAQSRAGGGDRRLRMVQARDRRRAAVRHAARSRRRPQAAAAGVLRRSSSANWRRSNFSARPTSATPCRSTCATSSRACSRPSRTSAPCTASSWRSPRAARGRRAAALLDGDEAALLRTLLAEHGQGRVPNERGPVRGLARLLRRNPTDAERTFWDALTAGPALRRPGLQAAGAGRAAHHRHRVVSAARRDRARAAGREARRPPKARAERRAWLGRARLSRVLDVGDDRCRGGAHLATLLDEPSPACGVAISPSAS